MASDGDLTGHRAPTAISKYMDGKIDSKEYFRQVRESTTKEVHRELRAPQAASAAEERNL